ncbi:hypothetical protein BOTBODRAFT_248500 [Botryobasidium botryosum FD-172 SS1]|uniref:Uncharacterized protein n=1 Tax=Botryobasidium botryosum (strain FD-172 SS1) TaxID=930990 RepID=A0A067MY28_BOTB1|nr:hypothetical protein BOTBODRAFT_248500 [Botryobasidium botryosum FD-172 SS1]
MVTTISPRGWLSLSYTMLIHRTSPTSRLPGHPQPFLSHFCRASAKEAKNCYRETSPQSRLLPSTSALECSASDAASTIHTGLSQDRSRRCLFSRFLSSTGVAAGAGCPTNKCRPHAPNMWLFRLSLEGGPSASIYVTVVFGAMWITVGRALKWTFGGAEVCGIERELWTTF